MAGFPVIVSVILALMLVGNVVMGVILSITKPHASEGLPGSNYTIVIESLPLDMEPTSEPVMTTAPPATTIIAPSPPSPA